MCTNTRWYEPRQVNPLVEPVQVGVDMSNEEDFTTTWSEGGRSYTIYKDDKINKPSHYCLLPDKGVEVIDVIEAAIGVNFIPNTTASHYANTLKYLLRCGRKGEFLEDLKKARFYLDRIITNIEKNTERY